jgi:hemolysin III
MEPAKKYMLLNEIANAVTHGLGTALAAAALVLLVVFACIYGDAWHIVSFSVYGATLVLLYLASTLYHSFQNEKVKHLFKILDHAAIFLLIAGTYTPFTLVTLRGAFGWTLFGIIWGLAAAGVVFKAFHVNRFAVLSTVFYVLMGWLIVISVKPLVLNLPSAGLYWLLAGGLSYTAGIYFYAQKQKLFRHAVWHLFVLGGSTAHFFAVLLYVLPLRR